MTRQVEMISLEELVSADHRYRYFKQILNESLSSAAYLVRHLI